jgi:hypothetical protein
MQIIIEIPDKIVEQLQAKWPNLPQRTLEILAAEAYRHEVITAAEVRRMLQLPSRLAADAFLKQEGADLHYTKTEIDQDIDTVAKVLSSYDRCL